jgi:hypothetical protein
MSADAAEEGIREALLTLGNGLVASGRCTGGHHDGRGV